MLPGRRVLPAGWSQASWGVASLGSMVEPLIGECGENKMGCAPLTLYLRGACLGDRWEDA